MARGKFGPTLAVNADEATIARLLARGPLLASPKLDGIRCMRRGGALVSRNLKPIPNRWINRALDHAGLEGFDGELIVGPARGEGVFNRSTSGVSSQAGEPDFAFHVFDLCTDFMWDYPFHQRLEMLRELHRGAPDHLTQYLVRLVDQHPVATPAELAEYEEVCVEMGYEGVMLRRPDAPYKRGRSTLNEGYLLKVKRFEDREAEVVGFEERMGNENPATRGLLGQTERSHRKAGMVGRGDLGALVVRDRERWAVDFSVGSGFTAAQRVELWGARELLAGRVVKYKFLPVGSIDRPRFPIFLGFREAFDR